MNETTKSFEAARLAVVDGEARGLSVSTMNKRWAAYFKAEDALKAATAEVAR
jgi:hypothetical protein